MKKTSILTLISVLLLNTNLVFAEENATQIDANNAKVEAIIAEIEKAKSTQKEEISPIEIKKEVAKTEIQKIEVNATKTQENILVEVKKAEANATKTQENVVVEAKKVEATETKAQENVVVEAKKVETTVIPTVVKEKPVVAIEKNKEVQTKKIVPKAREHILVMPRVPEPPKAIELSPKLITVDSQGNIIRQNIDDLYPKRKKVIFSDRIAPERFRKKKKEETKEILPGDIKNGRVAAYLQSSFLSVKEVSSRLKAAGFEVLSEFKVDKKGTVTSIVFTNPSMKSAASHKMRGFAGTLRIVVDEKNKLVNISNPIYVMKAFMQKEYNPSVAEKVLLDIRSQFSDLKNSPEVVKFLTLERYHFMENMPFYQDMKVIKKAKTEVLLKKIEKAKKKKSIAYVQKLENGSYVIGVELGSRTSKFVKKIGYQNSGLLPYPVLIEDGEAKILAPQYYIAVMYPMLKMSQFMTIATVPGAITKDIDKIFR